MNDKNNLKGKFIIQKTKNYRWIDIFYDKNKIITIESGNKIVFDDISDEEILLSIRDFGETSLYEKHNKKPLTEEDWLEINEKD